MNSDYISRAVNEEKPMLGRPLNHFKTVFAHKFFVAPSDRNYFFARFSKTYDFNEEFWWQALQTLEKLFKAGLILNGESVKKYNHNIVDLWTKHKEVFGDLAVTSLIRPNKLEQEFWSDRPLESFIAKVSQMGHPDSRYGLLPYNNSKDDLFKFDQLAFELRRRTIGLDWIVGEDFPDDQLTEFYCQPYRNVIAQRPEHQIRRMEIPKGSIQMMGDNLENVFHAWNFEYFRNDADLSRSIPRSIVPEFGGFGNSYLNLLWEYIDRTEISDPLQEQVNWLLESVKIGKDAENKFLRKLQEKPNF